MKKHYGIIYKATNKVNGKSYIGQTTKSLKHRINNHISKAFTYKCKKLNEDIIRRI
jgi:hypothetical protein